MGQKVWIIDDSNRQGAPEKIEKGASPREKKKENSRHLITSPTKNPALSISLSLIVWGGGQMYAGAYRSGSIFMAVMVVFCGTLFPLVHSGSASWIVDSLGLPTPILLSGGIVYLLAGLILWLVNVVDAYYLTMRLNSEHFRGVDNKLLPAICSALFPGWGQFLNGQPQKGFFFLLFGATGASAVFVLYVAQSVWPVFKGSPVGPIFEIFLVAAASLVPVYLLMWIIAVYDSIVACRERESLPTDYRKKKRWRLKNLLPSTTAVLSLLLAISVGVQYLPKEYYLDTLEKIRIESAREKMEIIPELAGRTIELVGR